MTSPRETPSVYLQPDVSAALRERGDNRSATINRDLQRLYHLYRAALREVPLTVPEACLILDTLNGTLIETNSAAFLWAEAEDAIRLNQLDRKWGVADPTGFVQRLRNLSPLQALAVADAAERFWHENPEEDARTAVRRYFHITESAPSP